MLLLTIECIFILLLFVFLAIILANERRMRARSVPAARVDAYWKGAERRKFFRFKRCLDATYRLEHKPHLRTYGRTADISEGGLQLVTDAKFSPGEILDLHLEIPGTGRQIEVEGKVIWCDEDTESDDPAGKRFFHVGVSFCGVKGHDARALAAYLGTLQPTQEQ